MSTVSEMALKLNKEYKDNNLAIKANVLPTYERLRCRDLGFSFPLWGGLPLGRICVFAGKEHSGKTTAACLQIAEYQRAFPDKTCIYIDVEHSLDLDFQAKMTGLELDKLYYVSPSNMAGEQILDMIIEFQESCEDIGCIVLDSIPALVSGKEIESDIEKDLGRSGNMARPLHRFTKRMADLVSRTGNIFIFVNQVRVTGTTYTGAVVYGEPGGDAPKYYASVKLRFGGRTFTKGDKVDVRESDAADADGFRLTYAITKNKTGSLTRGNGGFLTFRYDTGLDYMFDNIDICINSGLIQKPTNVTYRPINLLTGEVYVDENGNELKFVGRGKLIEYFNTHPKFKEEYMNMVLDYITNAENVTEAKDFVDANILKSIRAEEDSVENHTEISTESLNN